MSNIALVIRHNVRSQGAVRVTNKRTEYDLNCDLAVAIRGLNPARYVILCRWAGVGEVGRACGEADRKSVATSVELHRNSAAAVSATGTERCDATSHVLSLSLPALIGAVAAPFGLSDTIFKQWGAR